MVEKEKTVNRHKIEIKHFIEHILFFKLSLLISTPIRFSYIWQYQAGSLDVVDFSFSDIKKVNRGHIKDPLEGRHADLSIRSLEFHGLEPAGMVKIGKPDCESLP